MVVVATVVVVRLVVVLDVLAGVGMGLLVDKEYNLLEGLLSGRVVGSRVVDVVVDLSMTDAGLRVKRGFRVDNFLILFRP